MTARYSDLDAVQCAEIADACCAAGRLELIGSYIRDGMHPREVQKLLSRCVVPADGIDRRGHVGIPGYGFS